MKSNLKLTPFAVGVPAMSGNVMSWYHKVHLNMSKEKIKEQGSFFFPIDGLFTWH